MRGSLMPARPLPRLCLLVAMVCAATAFAGALGGVRAVDPGVAASSPPFSEQVGLKASPFDGGAWFVWDDLRSGGLWPDVYGARIANDGTVLDPGGRLIAGGPRAQELADVACAQSLCLM